MLHLIERDRDRDDRVIFRRAMGIMFKNTIARSEDKIMKTEKKGTANRHVCFLVED